jgi:uncharacterized protein (TIGR02391 family)
MHIKDLIPDGEALLALEPDELGVFILIIIKNWNPSINEISFDTFRDVHVGVNSTYPPVLLGEIQEACHEAWAWLEGEGLLLQDWRYRPPTRLRVLSRKAKRIAQDRDVRAPSRARSLPRQSLHPAIRDDVWGLFHRGQYSLAVFAAMKFVEVRVRDVAGLPKELLGVKLMRDAFSENGGPLTDMDAEGGERVARMNLFAGAIGSYKNPQSHRHVDLDDPDEALEIIMLANHLLRIVDARAAARDVLPPTPAQRTP